MIGLTGLPEFSLGDDVALAIVRAAEQAGGLCTDDLLVVAQKIISKVEGRKVKLTDVKPSALAQKYAKICEKDPRFVELVLRESESVEVVRPGHLIVTTKHGITCANAGIDTSNVEGDTETVLLLPQDPDTSARRLSDGIAKLTGKKVGVIISDTHGRTLREGQVNVAIGAAGVQLFRDYRGLKDSKGYTLRVKLISVADEIAAAAELVIGQAQEKIPVAIVRGLRILSEQPTSSRELNMSREKWFFKPELGPELSSFPVPKQ